MGKLIFLVLVAYLHTRDKEDYLAAVEMAELTVSVVSLKALMICCFVYLILVTSKVDPKMYKNIY
jgi:hypothetical protein